MIIVFFFLFAYGCEQFSNFKIILHVYIFLYKILTIMFYYIWVPIFRPLF